MADKEQKIKILLLYGKLLLQSNYDLSDIRNNLYSLMKKLEIDHLSFFMTQNGLMLIDEETDDVKMVESREVSYNFEKISRINQLIANYEIEHLSYEELYKELKAIDEKTYAFSIPLQILNAGIICISMYCLINGMKLDACYAFLLGSLGYYIFIKFQHIINIKLFSVFIYSIFISLCSILLFYMKIIDNDFLLILSCMMPFLPGATFVNSIKAGINGDYLVSLSQAMDAMTTALMLGLPVSVLLTIHF